MDFRQGYTFGDLLGGFRKRAAISARKLGEELHVHRNTIGTWERGDVLPERQKIHQLANALQLSEEEKNALLVLALEPVASDEYTRWFIRPSTRPKKILQRTAVVQHIFALLTQADTTAVILTGIAGVGKSTLASLIYEFAEQQRKGKAGPFTAPALWLTGAASMSMTDFTRILLIGLGKATIEIGNLSPYQQAVTLFTAIKTASPPRLIVIDQFEDMLANKADAQIDESGFQAWLDFINGEECSCRILLTSRRWPQDRRSICLQEYVVGSLQTTEGIELLQKEHVQESEQRLREAVEHCGGHPMALVLLARLMLKHQLTVKDIWSGSSNTWLWQEEIARKLLDAIYQQQLNSLEQQLLCAFSIYREPVVIDAVRPLLDEKKRAPIYAALHALLAQHLLQTSGKSHYRLHALVADYALERLRLRDEELLLNAHRLAAAFYRQRTAIYSTADIRKQLLDIHPQIQVAWHLCQAEEWAEAYEFMEREHLHDDLRRLGGNSVLLELYTLMLPLEKWQQDKADARRLYFYLGRAYHGLGQLERARGAYRQSLQCSLQAGDSKGQAEALTQLGVAYDDSGKKERAREYYQQALALYQELEDRQGIADVLMMLGWAYTGLWDYVRAREYGEQALAIFLELGDREGQSWMLGKLSAIYDNSGYKEQAKTSREQGLIIMREEENRFGEGWTLKHLGQLYHDLGQSERAINAFQQALAIFRSLDSPRGEAWSLNSLGKVYHDTGQQEQAIQVLEQSLFIFTHTVEDLWGKGAVLNKLGRWYQKAGDVQQSFLYYEQALQARKETGDLWGEAQTASHLGVLHAEQGRHTQALVLLEHARVLFEQIKSPDLQEVLHQIDLIHAQVGGRL